MAKPDSMLKRIEAFNQANGGGLAIQKTAKGYSLDAGPVILQDRGDTA